MSAVEVTLEESHGMAGSVEFIITNHGDETIRFLKWGTPFDDVENDCLDVKLNGQQICAYAGRQFKRIFNEKSSTITLKPRQKLKAHMHIPENWSLPAKGLYEITLKTTHLRVITKTQGIKKQSSPSFRSKKISSRSILIVVEDPHGFKRPYQFAAEKSGKPRKFSSKEIEQMREEKSSIPVCPPNFLCIAPTYDAGGECFMARYVGHPKTTSGPDKGTIKNYADLIKRAMAFILGIRGDWKFENDPVYKKWFGVYTPQRGTRVKRVLNNALGAVSCFNFLFYIDVAPRGKDVIAWWQRSNDSNQLSGMGFCPAFFKLKHGGMNSRMGTIGHELTHAYGSTQDHCYGINECLNLAKSNPDFAIDNADSYQFFMEEKIGLQPI